MESTNQLRSPRLTTGVLTAGAGTGVGLAAATTLALRSGNTEFLLYIGVVLLLCLAIGVVHWRIRLSTPLLTALGVWAMLHMAGGLVPVPESWLINGDIRVLYSWWVIPIGDGGLKYDHVVHAYGFGTATWLCWEGLLSVAGSGAFRNGRPGFGALFLALLGGCGLGCLNEIVEFAATQLTTTNVGGYVNTGWDLVANLIGCTCSAVLIRLLGAGRRAVYS